MSKSKKEYRIVFEEKKTEKEQENEMRFAIIVTVLSMLFVVLIHLLTTT